MLQKKVRNVFTLPKPKGHFLLDNPVEIADLIEKRRKNPQEFKNADDFELERYKQPTSKHLAFGHGAHHYIGSNLAWREGRIAFEVLSQRLPNLRLSPNQKLENIPALMSRGFKRLDLEWDLV